MKSAATRSRYVPIAAIVAAGAVLVGGAYLLYERSLERALSDYAVSSAEGWAEYLASNIDDLEGIAAGDPPNVATVAFVGQTLAYATEVFRFRIFDNAGRPRLVSGETDWAGGIVDDEEGIDITRAVEVMATGQPATWLETGSAPRQPKHYAQVFYPVVLDNEMQTIVEVHVDTTREFLLFNESFRASGGLISALAAFAFGIPAVVLYRRSREKREAEAKLRYLAHHDSLTESLNRQSFEEQLEEHLAAGRAVAVMYIDIDRFKEVNDTLGHSVGDELIRAIASRIKTTVREGSTIGRYGGDEFVVAIVGFIDHEAVEAIAARLGEALSVPYSVEGHRIDNTVSIGIGMAPTDGSDAKSLIRSADVALYSAKRSGRDHYKFFDRTMLERMSLRRDLEQIVRRAVAENDFHLHYQPLVAADTDHSVTGFEALLRLTNDQGEQISPMEFVPILEEIGLISAVGEWVIRSACEFARGLPDDMTVAVNLSPKQFVGGKLIGIVEAALAANELEGSRLELEVTESLLLADSEAVIKELVGLKALGVTLAMDDFGTGYSSLAYLWRYPFDRIKLDRSFMGAFESDPAKVEAMLSSVVALGRNMALKITAEGIETIEQAVFVARLGADRVQGFLFGRPMPSESIAATLLERNSAGASDAGARRSLRVVA